MISGDDHAWRPSPARAGDEDAESLPGCRDLVEIARGGDSVVYRAWQVNPGRHVAVKVLDVDDDATAARFARELAITVDLGRQHPHIVTVLETGLTSSGRPCIVMDLAELGTLHDRLQREGPLPAGDVVTVGTVVSDALAFAHARGVLHRDVKPQNILILPTSYVLTDFGIARLSDSEHTASVERFTYRHASPQVLDGYAPTASDDVWSLGSTLFTLLDGRPPFADDDPDEDTALAYLRRVRTLAPRRLDARRVPGDLAAIVMRCLDKDPARRWSDAAELHAALAALPSEVRRWSPAAEPAPPAPSAPPADEMTRQRPRPTTPPAAPDPWAPRPSAAASAPPEHATTPIEPAPAPSAASVPVEPPATPVEPVAVAPSALSHLRDLPPEDAAPTGRPPFDDVPVATGPPAVPEPEVADAPPSPWRRRLVIAACLVVGLGVGTVIALSRGSDDDATRAGRDDASPTAGPLPTAASAPTDTTLAQPPVADPRFAARIQDWRDNGSTIDITWTDRTGGKAKFVVAESTTGIGTGNYEVPAGQTSFSVPVDPDQKRVCLVVLTVPLDGSGVYPGYQRCAPRR